MPNQQLPESSFFSKFDFIKPIELPVDYEVYDFSRSYDPERPRWSDYGVGKYNEKRPGMYTGSLYEDQRDVHVGLDIAAPVGTPIRSFYAGKIFCYGYNSQPFDYGYTIITSHQLAEHCLFVLWGHLSASSVKGKSEGQEIAAGEEFAWIGEESENGGWNPHLHFQMSWLKPEKPDLPGVVSEKDREWALRVFPDPQLIWGALY